VLNGTLNGKQSTTLEPLLKLKLLKMLTTKRWLMLELLPLKRPLMPKLLTKRKWLPKKLLPLKRPLGLKMLLQSQPKKSVKQQL